jgi:hypothetical protein
VEDGAARKKRKVFEQGGGLGASVGFDEADEHVDAGGAGAAGGGEHGVGFAHAGGHAEEDREASAAVAGGFAPERREEGVGIGAERI